MKIVSWFIGLSTKGCRAGLSKSRLKVGDTITHERWGDCVITGGSINVTKVEKNAWGSNIGVTINLKDFVD